MAVPHQKNRACLLRLSPGPRTGGRSRSESNVPYITVPAWDNSNWPHFAPITPTVDGTSWSSYHQGTYSHVIPTASPVPPGVNFQDLGLRILQMPVRRLEVSLHFTAQCSF